MITTRSRSRGVAMRVNYPKDMRDQAKRERKSLVTLAVDGLTVQAPITADEAREITEFVNRFLEKRRG